MLERHKRIALRGDGCNTIERRYRVYDADATLREEFTTCETIRPHRAATLREAAADAGLGCRALTLDYGAGGDPAPRASPRSNSVSS